MGEKFLIKVIGQLGGDANDSKEMRVLNRILRWDVDGIRYEADPRHHELILKGGPRR